MGVNWLEKQQLGSNWIEYQEIRIPLFQILISFGKENNLINLSTFFTFKNTVLGPGWVAQLVGALIHAPKDCRLNSWSGHIPRLWVQSPVRVYT